MEQDGQELVLVARLDAAAGRRLEAELRARRGHPLVIDAGRVEVVSALALEVLLSAALQWRIDGQALEIARESAAFRSACTTLDLSFDPLPELPPADSPPPAADLAGATA